MFTRSFRAKETHEAGSQLHRQTLWIWSLLSALAILSTPRDGWTKPPQEQVDAAPSRQGAELQVAMILTTRPKMVEPLKSRPELREWITTRFEAKDPPLYWSSDPPVSGRLAEFDTRDSTRYFVRVSEKASGIDQLVNLIFELNNFLGAPRFDEIHEQAVRGELDREEYAMAMLEQEMVSLRGARAVYRDLLGELSEQERREARGYYRLMYGPDDAQERIDETLEKGFDLRDHFRALYDEYVVPEMEQ